MWGPLWRLDDGRMGSAAQQVLRDAQIRAADAVGESTASLADRFGLSKSRIKEIVAAEPPAVEPAGRAVRLAEERRAAYRHLLAEVRDFTAFIPETQPAAKVGGFQLQLDGLDRLTSLEQKLGYLPTDLAELGHKREFAQTIIDIFAQHDVSADVKQAVLAALESDEGTS